MRLDAVTVRRLAGDRGFVEATLEKALRLADVLYEIGRHPYLHGRLVLKGGTALNLFYWDHPRLSVDIDVNYVGGVALEKMQAERPEVLTALRTVAEAGGCRVQRGTEHHASETWHLWYRSALGPQDHLEIDTNFLMRLCLFPPEERPCTLGLGASPVRFSVLALEELIAGKLVALLDRTAPRDLYDAYRFVSSGVPYEELRLRQAFVFLATIGLPHPLAEYDLSRVSRSADEEVERSLCWRETTARP
jgi:predicted nucleotidyltransferase component of viral defense system